MTNDQVEMRRGFLLMPFREDLEPIREIIVAAGRDSGVAIERADDIFRPGVVVEQILEAIDTAAVVVALCTGRNANVFFEMGWAWRIHDPILVAATTDDLPFDIQHLRAVIYGHDDHPNQSIETLHSRLTSAINEALASPKMPRGRRLSEPPRQRTRASVKARLIDKGQHNYAIEINNNGNVDLNEVTLELPEDAVNWHVATDMFTSYPIMVLQAGQFERAAAMVSAGGPISIHATVRGKTPDGEEVTHTDLLTIL
ncbi:MAG: hypothetical protein DCC49_09330 [Acidobacteria bacterium]|nr:MAG: hypothetical protein DCC49_09330 [Acidobacteriota bacterium]